MTKLGVRCIVQKSRPNSNLGVIATLGAHPQKCRVELQPWENRRSLSSLLIKITELMFRTIDVKQLSSSGMLNPTHSTPETR